MIIDLTSFVKNVICDECEETIEAREQVFSIDCCRKQINLCKECYEEFKENMEDI